MIELKIDTGINRWELMDLKLQYRYNRGWKRAVTAIAAYVHYYSDTVIPVDTGYMRSTGYNEVRGDGFRARGYVGYRAHYAMFQHEATWWNHKPGQQAKFIEYGINRMLPRAPQMIYDAIENGVVHSFRYTAPPMNGGNIGYTP